MNYKFFPTCYILEDDEADQLAAMQTGQAQPPDGAEEGSEEGSEDTNNEMGDATISKLVDLEFIQKYIMFLHIIKFKERFESRLNYIKINNSDSLNNVRDTLEVLIEFYNTFSFQQITELVSVLIDYLDDFKKQTIN